MDLSPDSRATGELGESCAFPPRKPILGSVAWVPLSSKLHGQFPHHLEN